MATVTHFSAESIKGKLPLAYFQKEYFQTQAYSQFVAYSNEDFFIPFDITQENAISIPMSPFGSFIHRKGDENSFEAFIESISTDLNKKKVGSMIIHHPSNIYSSMVQEDWIRNTGFRELYQDINQHIELKPDWEGTIHNMQKRKLESLRNEGFEFRTMEKDEFEVAHQFLSVCRQAQGLQINITWDKLKTLTEKLPDSYDCFGVFREDKISSLCICVKVDRDVAYYYLPATSPMFRDKSPMVLLISGMVDHYLKEGFKIFDLGVSSYQGSPQETLRMFKNRMGAIETLKTTFVKEL